MNKGYPPVLHHRAGIGPKEQVRRDMRSW